MNKELILALIKEYGFTNDDFIEFNPLGNGLIHGTYKLFTRRGAFVLQEYNLSVFPFPDRISTNLSILKDSNWVETLPFLLPLPERTTSGDPIPLIDGKYWRLFPFVDGKTLEQIQNPQQARLAARAFGQFTGASIGENLENFQETIPNFHRLDLRFQKFEEVLSTSKNLNQEESQIAEFYQGQKPLIDWYLQQIENLPLRVTHNDTKINNLIFSQNLDQVQALIDLDTVMGGYLMYDFGDLVRTVTCSLPETSTSWNELYFIPELFNELLAGYWDGVKEFSTKEESKSLLFGGEVMTLIMGLRFFTDHLQGNIYYRVSYPEQNLHRAKNQMIFLESQQKHREVLLSNWSNITGLD